MNKIWTKLITVMRNNMDRNSGCITCRCAAFLLLNLIQFTDCWSIWTSGVYRTEWEWSVNNRSLASTYARWAPGEPSSTAGSILMTYEQDYAFTVAEPSLGSNVNLCEKDPVNNTCDGGWGSPVLGKCYQMGFSGGLKNWQQTVDICISKGALILSTETSSEYNFLKNWLLGAAPPLPTTTTEVPAASTQITENTKQTAPSTTITTSLPTTPAPTPGPTPFATTTTTPAPPTTTKPTTTTTTTKSPTTTTTTSTTTKLTPVFSYPLPSTPSIYPTYVTCYVATTTTLKPTTTTTRRRNVTLFPTTSPTPTVSDPATTPDMALIPASIGLTAMIALLLALVGIFILDLAALKRDIGKLKKNIRYVCKNSANPNKVHVDNNQEGLPQESGPDGIDPEGLSPESGPDGIDPEGLSPESGPDGIDPEGLSPESGPNDFASDVVVVSGT